MNNLNSQSALFPSQADYKEVRSKVPLMTGSFDFPRIYKNPASQRTLRRKRQTEEYEHFAAVVFDEDGNHHLLASHSLKRQKRFILADAVVRAREVLDGASGFREVGPPLIPQTIEGTHKLQTPPSLTGTISLPFEPQPQYAVNEDSEIHQNAEIYTTKLEDDQSREARGPRCSVSRKEISFPSKLQAIRIDETARWVSWFLDGFTSIQQTACRTIAKEWIKVIHPKKQSTHPYNGKMPRNEGGSPDPERTRPPYWPPHVRHKEPDHIDKADRTALLVHLLMNTPQEEIVPDKVKSDRSFRARELLAALRKKQDEGVSAKWRIVEELVNAREALESFETGGLDGDAVMHVPDWGEVLRPQAARKRGATSSQPAGSIGNEMDTAIDDLSTQHDDDFMDEAPDVDTPKQHSQQDFELHEESMNATSGFLIPVSDVHQASKQPPNPALQQMRFHAPFPEQSSHRIGSTGKHDKGAAGSKMSVGVSIPLYQEAEIATNHTTPRSGGWPGQPEPLDGSILSSGYRNIDPYDGGRYVTDGSRFPSTQSISSAHPAQDTMSSTPYGSNNTCSFNMNRSTDVEYGYHQIQRYQPPGYGSQYGISGHFLGIWEPNSGKDHDIQGLAHHV